MSERENKLETYGRGYAWSLVTVFTTISVALNASHAVLGMGGRSGAEQAMSALVAAVAPLSLLLATELVVKLIRGWNGRRRWLSRLRGASAAVTAGIAVLAFALSFVALRDMAELMGVDPSLAWAVPAVVDAMIVIATLAVVIAEAEMALDRAEADARPDVVPAESESTISTVQESSVSPVYSAVDSAPEYSGVHELECAVQIGAESTKFTGHPAPVPTVDSAGDLHDTVDAVVGRATEYTMGSVDTGAPVDAESTDLVATEPTESTGFEPVDVSGFAEGESAEYIVDSCSDDVDSAEVESTESTSPVSTESNRDSSLGERVVAVLGTDADPATVAEALRLRAEEDLSLRRIAEQLGVRSHSTIRKWIQAAEEEQAQLALAGS